MTDQPSRRPARLALAAAAVVGLAAGAAGVYVSGWGAVHADDRCTASMDLAGRLKPLATGELAALIPADVPQDLTALAFQTVDGAPKTIGDFAGQALLLNLWATWCGPCRAEMPALDRLQAAAGSDAFTVLTVNIDVGDPARPAAFLQEIGVTALPDYRDPRLGVFNELKGKGLAFGLPTTLAIDAKGCQVAALHGPAHWDSAEGKAVAAALAVR